MALNIAVIFGSVREGRHGIKAARFVVNQLKKRGHTVNLIDPVEYEFPLLKRMYKQYEKGQAPEPLETVAKILREADAYVIVSAEYNHGVPAALKNILDHYQTEYFFKPSGIVTYSVGTFGGVRAAVQLRSILPELGMSPIPVAFPISKVHESFDEKGNAIDKAYERRIKKFLDELAWYAHALGEARKKGNPY